MGPPTHSLLLNGVKQTYITPHNISNVQCFFLWHTSYFVGWQTSRRNCKIQEITDILESPNVFLFVLLKYFANGQIII